MRILAWRPIRRLVGGTFFLREWIYSSRCHRLSSDSTRVCRNAIRRQVLAIAETLDMVAWLGCSDNYQLKAVFLKSVQFETGSRMDESALQLLRCDAIPS